MSELIYVNGQDSLTVIDLSRQQSMSGQEWYDRFVAELKKQPDAGGHVPYYSTQAILEAARKATGGE